MRARNLLAVIALVAALVLSGLYLSTGSSAVGAGSASPALAPDFALETIYGQPFTLAQYRNSSVVVIEFTSLTCSECQIVEQSLHSIYAGYNVSGRSDVQIISIYTDPQFTDTIPALKSYHASHNITWTMAQDTMTDAVYHSYGGEAIPYVVIIDKQGYAVYGVTGAQSTAQLTSTISSALAGKAAAISIVTVSVFLLAAVAGVSTFFSPCAFPMFPGYMSLFLGLNVSSSATPTSGGTYRGAVRRALYAGSISATGMMVVFLLLGVAFALAAGIIGSYIPDLLILVGAVLIVLGGLLLTNLQYWRIVTPLQSLWRRISGGKTEEGSVIPASATGSAFYLKLFGYGMGYAAAAAGCVFPVILSAIVAGFVLGPLGGAINILIYSLTAALLMIVVTVMLAMAGQRYVNQLKAYTPLIKKVSAVALVLVGIYLIYFFYTAWIV